VGLGDVGDVGTCTSSTLEKDGSLRDSGLGTIGCLSGTLTDGLFSVDPWPGVTLGNILFGLMEGKDIVLLQANKIYNCILFNLYTDNNTSDSITMWYHLYYSILSDTLRLGFFVLTSQL